MDSRIICVSVENISLTEEDRLVLLLVAHRIIARGFRRLTATYDDITIDVTIGCEYVHFMGLRSRQFHAFIGKVDRAGTASYLVDEKFLRSVSEEQVSTMHFEEQRSNAQKLKIIQPPSASCN